MPSADDRQRALMLKWFGDAIDDKRAWGDLMVEILAQIHAPHFHAGIVLWDDKVVEAAPIVLYMKKGKWHRDRVREYCQTKGWTIEVVWKMER